MKSRAIVIDQQRWQPKRSAAVLTLAALSFVHNVVSPPTGGLTLAGNNPGITSASPQLSIPGRTHFIDRASVQPRRDLRAATLVSALGTSPNVVAVPVIPLQLNAFPPLFILQATPIYSGQDLQTDKDFSEYWQPERRNYLALYQFPGSNAVNVNTALLNLTGLTPTVAIGGSQFIQPPLATLALAAQTPAVSNTTATILTIPLTQLQLAGLNPVFVGSNTYLIPTGALSLTGFAPQVGQVVLITMPYFIGEYIGDALIQAAGLQLTTNVIQIGYPSTQDVVVDQVPPPNVMVLNTSGVILYRGLPYFLGTGNRHDEPPNLVNGPNDLNSDNGEDI
jgi:hypothetical protein